MAVGLNNHLKSEGQSHQLRDVLYKAREAGQTILGRHAARRQLWEFVGPETIVVVHGGHQDLLSLRWLHYNVIDTLSCESRLEEPQVAPNLANLARVHLGRRIQHGQNGHDSLEDAQATRDLVHWYVKNPPASTKVQVEGIAQ